MTGDAVRRIAALAGLVTLVVQPAIAQEQSPRVSIAAGNAHYLAGEYAAALEAYAAVDEEADPTVLPELLNDRAAAHFALGQYEDARGLWVRAAGLCSDTSRDKTLRDAAFEARMRYNLGNVNYAEALAGLAAAEGDQAQEQLQAIGDPVNDALDRAIAQYRDALRLDAGLADARVNLELACRLKKELQPPDDQPPQSQPSSQPSSQPRDEAEQQDGEGQQQGDPQQDDKQQGDRSQERDPQQGQQGEQGQRDQQDQNQSGQQQAGDDQQSEGEQTSGDQPPAGEQQSADQQEPQPGESSDAAQQPPARPISLTKQQVEALLQRIQDKAKERREQLRLRAAQQARREALNRPVEKDW